MRIVNRILLVLVCLILVGFLTYKIAYPYVAPLVFDYIVDHNLNAFIKLEQSLTESLTEEALQTESQTDSQQVSSPETTEPDSGEADSSKKDQNTDSGEISPGEPATEKTELTADSKQDPVTEKPNTDIQSVKTTMGVFSGEHLARALKNMSPKDKTRIISLCQNAVSTSDILKVSKMMMQDGLTKDQQKYIENYLRDNLSVPDKREILEILKKY